MSVYGVSSAAISSAYHTTGNLTVEGATGIAAIAGTVFSSARAELPAETRTDAIRKAEAEDRATELAKVEKHINRLSGGNLTNAQQVERARWCISHANLIRTVSSSTAPERTSSINRAYRAAADGARFSVEGLNLEQAGSGPDALIPWIRQIRFLTTAARLILASDSAQAAEHLQTAIDVVESIRRAHPDATFLPSDQRLFDRLPGLLKDAQPSYWLTLVNRTLLVSIGILVWKITTLPTH